MFLGVVLTVHLSMNGKVGAVLGNPRVGNALFWCIGAVWAIVIGVSGWHTGALAGLKQVNPLLLTAGAIGAINGGLNLAVANGGPGTGNGVVGGAAALVLGLIAVAIGALALARSRRAILEPGRMT